MLIIWAAAQLAQPVDPARPMGAEATAASPPGTRSSDADGTVKRSARAAPVPVVTSGPTQQGTPRPPAPEPRLLGDWAGVRSAMARAGLTPTIQFVSEAAANVNGGTSRDVTNVTQLSLGTTADLKKLTGSVPGTFQLTVTKRSGPRLDDVAGLHLLQFSQELWGRGRIWRLTQAWYRVVIGPAEIKVGRVGVGEDFNSARCDFQSLYLCSAGTGHTASDYWHNYPSSQWGARVRYDLRPDLYLQSGVYQVNPRNIDPRRGGFYLGLKDGLGVLLPSEIGYSPRIAGRLPGLYKAGFFYSNAEHADVLLDIDGGIRRLTGRPALIRHRQWAVFGNVRQQITLPRADGSGGLSAFFNGTWASRGTPTVESKFAVGLNYSGPFRVRPTDEIGFGIGTGRLNDRLTDLQRELNAAGVEKAPVRSAEYTAELYYGIDVRSGLTVRPNIQFTVNPAGDPGVAPVTVLGLKVVTAL